MTLDRSRRRLLAAGAAATASAVFGAAVLAQPDEKVIRIVAKKFEYTPSEITLEKGVPVTLELVVEEVNHADEVTMGFYAPELGARAEIVPGKAARVRVVPEKEGSFEFHCDIFCGEGHEDMNGMFHVV